MAFSRADETKLPTAPRRVRHRLTNRQAGSHAGQGVAQGAGSIHNRRPSQRQRARAPLATTRLRTGLARRMRRANSNTCLQARRAGELRARMECVVGPMHTLRRRWRAEVRRPTSRPCRGLSRRESEGLSRSARIRARSRDVASDALPRPKTGHGIALRRARDRGHLGKATKSSCRSSREQGGRLYANLRRSLRRARPSLLSARGSTEVPRAPSQRKSRPVSRGRATSALPMR